MPSVNIDSLLEIPRRRRELWLIMLTKRAAGMNMFKQISPMARIQSLVAKPIMDCIKREPRAPMLIAFAPISKYTHMNKATKPATQNAISVPVKRIDAPAMALETHIVNKRIHTISTNCFIVFSNLVTSCVSIKTPLTKQKTAINMFTPKAANGVSQTRNQIVAALAHLSDLSSFSSLFSVSSGLQHKMVSATL